MPQYKRHFTVAEVRAMLPELRRAFARIHALMAEIRRQRGAAGGDVTFYCANGQAARVTGGDDGARLAEIQRILGDLDSRGILVKDLRRGLCDFPCLMPPDGEEVLLCWELCESNLTHWHTIAGGYSARQPLNE